MRLPDPGELFQNRYRIDATIGEGGFARVYRATELEIDRRVAIKVLAPRDDYAGVAARFMREARVIGGFRDPHTITMYDFGRTDDGLLYMVFEFVEGEDLSELLGRRGALPELVVEHVVRQVLHALREAHQAQILHRDIKPANILIYSYMGDDYRVKLLDFGIAKAVSPDVEGLTRDGAMVGTLRYMAPEQMAGETMSPATDLYSLGLVAQEMLTGERVIGGTTTREIVKQQLSEERLRLPVTAPVSAGLRQIVERLTERNPAARFSSAAEALQALEQLGVARTTEERAIAQAAARQERLPQSEPEELSKGALVVAGVAVAVIALLLVGALAKIVMRSDDTPAPRPPIVLPTQAPVVPLKEEVKPPRTEDVGVADSSGQEETEELEDAGGAEEPLTRSAGCGQELDWEGGTVFQTTVDFKARSWFLYVPKGYDPERAYPVVTVLHETMKTGREVSVDLKLMEWADRDGFIIVGPDQISAFEAWPREDAKFVKKAVEQTRLMTCADLTRHYVIGSGTGAKMARIMPCEMDVSAVAIATAGMPADEHICLQEVPVPLFRMQGNKDPYAPLKGGPNCMEREYLSQRQIENHWKNQLGCSGKRKSYVRRKGGSCVTWDCDAKFVSCTLYGGHRWVHEEARSLEFPQCVADTVQFPYQRELWKFFQKHGRVLKPTSDH